MRGKKRMLSALLILVMLAAMGLQAGCAAKAEEHANATGKTDVPKGEILELTANAAGTPRLEGENFKCFSGEEDNVTDFGIKLFQQTLADGKNSMISPLSAILALAMTAQGAQGETREELETLFNTDIDYLCAVLNHYQNALMNRENAALAIANSIWIRDEEDRLTVEEQFLVDSREYFHAQAYQAAFDDETVKAMNEWCKEKTGGMIEEIVEELTEEQVMHLLNAVSFNAVWEKPYHSYQVGNMDFHTESGKAQKMEAMFGEESLYIADEKAQGFIKPYEDGYAFMALLPKEGVSVADYVASMTGESFRALLRNASEETVQTVLPKFTSEYSVEMIPALRALGVELLFDDMQADLSGLGTSTRGNLYVSAVFQKTFITVDTEGTRAAAVTDVVTEDKAAPLETKVVRLDRPFIYAIIDTKKNVPIFMGTVMEMA